MLDSLARQLHVPFYGGGGPSQQPPPFSGEEWAWQLPDAKLILENGPAEPPRLLPLEPQAAAAAKEEAEAEGARQPEQPPVALPADPRHQPAVALELAAARSWYRGGRDEQPPTFALPAEEADSGRSWSMPTPAEGQPEVSSAAAAAAEVAAAGEERAPGDGGEWGEAWILVLGLAAWMPADCPPSLWAHCYPHPCPSPDACT